MFLQLDHFPEATQQQWKLKQTKNLPVDSAETPADHPSSKTAQQQPFDVLRHGWNLHPTVALIVPGVGELVASPVGSVFGIGGIVGGQ